MVAAVLLHHSKPTITFKKIKIATTEMFNLMKKKNIKTYLPNPPNNWEISEIIKKLDFKVVGNFNNKSGKTYVDL